MSDDARPDRAMDDPDGAAVRRVLARYGRDHEPVTERIEARLAESQRAWMLGAESDAGSDRSPLPSRRVTLGLLAAAAAVVAVLALGNLPGRGGDNTIAGQPSGGPDGAPASVSAPPGPASTTDTAVTVRETTPPSSGAPAPSDGSSSAPPATGAPSPSPSTTPVRSGSASPTSGSTASTTQPSTGNISASSSTASTPSSSSDPPGSTINVSDLPSSLELSADGYIDWIITGARSDGKSVRLSGGPGVITVAGPAPAPRSVAAPLEVSWSNGNPEQSNSGKRTWWSAPAQPTVFTVTVAGRAQASEVALYAGGSGPVQVTVTVKGLGSRRLELPADDSGTAGMVVVGLDDSARGRDVTFVVGAPSGMGTVALGDVTVR